MPNNFGEYAVARIADVPQMTVHVVPSADPQTGRLNHKVKSSCNRFSGAFFMPLQILIYLSRA